MNSAPSVDDAKDGGSGDDKEYVFGAYDCVDDANNLLNDEDEYVNGTYNNDDLEDVNEGSEKYDSEPWMKMSACERHKLMSEGRCF